MEKKPMTNIRGIFATIFLGCVVIIVAGCYHHPNIVRPQDITLRGYSKANYGAIESRLQDKVCVKGRVSIDSMGVYYPLQPVEDGGVVNLGFSRIKTDLDRSFALRRGLTNRSVHTVCGLLEEATPFKGCDEVECKWYALTGATLPE